MDVADVRSNIPLQNLEEFDGIVNQKILGASTHIKMIGSMIENIAKEGAQQSISTKEIIRRIKKVSGFFVVTRGAASQAISNAIYIMIRGIDQQGQYSVEQAVQNIIAQKNRYEETSFQATARVVQYAVEMLKDKENIFLYDYSSTVDKAVASLPKERKYKIYIAESRVIDGGKPFLKGALSINSDIVFFPDAALMHFLKMCDVALMGAETFYADGTGFNTIGSDIVGLACKEFKVPLYFLTPMIKLDIRTLEGYKKAPVMNDVKDKLLSGMDLTKKDFDRIHSEVPELLGVPSEHIAGYVTEKGILPASQMFYPSVLYAKELRGESDE